MVLLSGICTDFREFGVNNNGQNLRAVFVRGSPQRSVLVELLWREGSVDEKCKKWSISNAIKFS